MKPLKVAEIIAAISAVIGNFLLAMNEISSGWHFFFVANFLNMFVTFKVKLYWMFTMFLLFQMGAVLALLKVWGIYT